MIVKNMILTIFFDYFSYNDYVNQFEKRENIMKKTVNGATYDTKTAKAIACYNNNLPQSNPCYVTEILYLTPKGKFFLHGKGGPLSQYGLYSGTNRRSREHMIPMTEIRAREWVERYLSEDDCIAIFGKET